MSKVKAIYKEGTTKFDASCLAEIFFMEKYSRTEYVRGCVCVTCHVVKGLEKYTVSRYSTKEDNYGVILKNVTIDEVARELYKCYEYETLDWEVEYKTAMLVWNKIA